MLDVIADRLLGVIAGDVMGVVSIISIAASISAMTFAGPRVYYAMARDGLFFRGAAHVHPRYQTPAASIVAQADVEWAPRALRRRERAHDLHRFCCGSFLGHRGRLAVRAAPARARRATALPRVGLSNRARDLRDSPASPSSSTRSGRTSSSRCRRARHGDRRPRASSSSPWAFPSISSSAGAKRRDLRQLSVVVSGFSRTRARSG